MMASRSMYDPSASATLPSVLRLLGSAIVSSSDLASTALLLSIQLRLDLSFARIEDRLSVVSDTLISVIKARSQILELSTKLRPRRSGLLLT